MSTMNSREQIELISKSEAEVPLPQPEADVDRSTLLGGKQLSVVFSAFLLAFMLVALDQTILSTALPTIASHFQAVSDLSWIASAYFLPQAGLMLFFGKILAIAPPKPVFLTSIFIFELGSLFCAVAPSVNFLIFGRAVAGFGAAGIWVSILSIIARITTMAQRPILMGLFGVVFSISSVAGPLLGGVLADRVSWRWCFYINLPIGAFSILVTVFSLPNHPSTENTEPHLRRWLILDWVGTFLSVTMVTLLLLALQWGGNTKPWNDPAVVTTIVLAFVVLVAFVVWERRLGSRAMLPIEVFSNNSIVGASVESFFVNFCFILANYYLPLFFQVKGHSATRSGIDILPFMLAGILSVLFAGAAITVSGRPWPFLFFFPLIAAVGLGLLFTIDANTHLPKLIGFQILVGVGLGAAIQNTVVVAQAEYADNEALVPQVTSLITFMQLVGSSIALAAAEAVFSSQLKAKLHAVASGLSPEVTAAVLASVKAIFSLPAEEKALATTAYIYAVEHIFLMGVPGAALASLSALLITRRKITPGMAPPAA